jgi:hypothetical protein
VEVIRRRYGTVSQVSGLKLKYHEYNLVEVRSGDGSLSDSKGCTLFHLLPTSGLKDERDKKRSHATASAGNPDMHASVKPEKRRALDLGPLPVAGGGPPPIQHSQPRADAHMHGGSWPSHPHGLVSRHFQ